MRAGRPRSQEDVLPSPMDRPSFPNGKAVPRSVPFMVGFSARFHNHRARYPIFHRLAVRLPEQPQEAGEPHRNASNVAAVPDKGVEERERQSARLHGTDTEKNLAESA